MGGYEFSVVKRAVASAATIWAGEPVVVAIRPERKVPSASRLTNGDGLRLDLNGGQDYHTFIHEVGHLRHSEMDNGRLENARVADPDTMELYNLFEDSRVNQAIDSEWDVGQVEWEAESWRRADDETDHASTISDYARRRMFLLGIAMAGLPLPDTDEGRYVLGVYEHFKDRIQSSRLDENAHSTFHLALDVAPVLFRVDEDEESGWRVSDHLTPIPIPPQGGGEGTPEPRGGEADKAIVDGGLPPPPSGSSPKDVDPKLSEDEAKDKAEALKKLEALDREDIRSRKKERIERVKEEVAGSEDHNHTNIVTRISEAPVELGADYALQLDQFLSSMGTIRPWGVSGKPTHKAWKLNVGDARVFRSRPRTQGDITVMVDMSGSMGCACQRCATREVARLNGPKNNRARAAWSAATMITAAFPEASTFGFCSSYDTCYIAPIENGMMPACRDNAADPNHPHRDLTKAGGNSDCAALLFLRHASEGGYAIIISDGAPGIPSPMDNNHLEEHTRTLANRYFAEGMRFGSVLVGSHRNKIYPSEMTVRGERPEELAQLLEWLVVERGM